MKIGIVGAGSIGGTLARLWAEAGHEIAISSRHPGELEGLAKEIGKGTKAVTPAEAAAFGEAVLLAIPLKGRKDTVAGIRHLLEGKLVIDAMNPFPGRDGSIAEEIISSGIASGAATSEQLSESDVVRAFSSVYFKQLESEAHRSGEKLAIPMAGDRKDAKQVAEQLIRDAGFEPFDLGGLSESKPLDPDGALFGKALTVKETRKLLQKE